MFVVTFLEFNMKLYSSLSPLGAPWVGGKLKLASRYDTAKDNCIPFILSKFTVSFMKLSKYYFQREEVWIS